jgi:cell division septation protein DedD
MKEGPADAQASTAEAGADHDASVPAVMPDSSPVATAAAPTLRTTRPESTDTVAVAQQPAAMPATVTTTTPAAEAKSAAAAQPASGVWVVNLASYNHESMAQRMLQEFKDKGVAAELVKVTVNDKPMVRIRTTGYGSFREASDWAALLEERLELDGAWVSRR